MEFETRESFEDFAKSGKLTIGKDNPRICLSPNRYLGRCYECPAFETQKGKRCDSAIVINEEVNKKRAIKEEVKLLKRQIKLLKGDLNEKENLH